MGFPDADGDCRFGTGNTLLFFFFFYLEWTDIVSLGRLQNKALVAINGIANVFDRGDVSGVLGEWWETKGAGYSNRR